MWVCLGAVVGASVALLYAPCSGRETRDVLARKARAIKDKTKHVVEGGKKAFASARRSVEAPSFSSTAHHS
jgi:gas vesicle protein